MIGGFFALMTFPLPYDWAALLIRIAVGGALLPFGLNKVMHRHNYANFPKVPLFSQKGAYYSAMIIETIGSICILCGFFTRLAALPVICCMAVAVSTARGHYFTAQALVFLLGAIAVFCIGAGMYSLDGLLLASIPR